MQTRKNKECVHEPAELDKTQHLKYMYVNECMGGMRELMSGCFYFQKLI